MCVTLHSTSSWFLDSHQVENYIYLSDAWPIFDPCVARVKASIYYFAADAD